MPTLKIFGRKIFFAGDDIRSILIIHAIFNTTQVALAISLLARRHWENVSEIIEKIEMEMDCDKEGAEEYIWTIYYSATALSLSSLNLCLVVPMFRYSGKGTPTETGPREPLRKFCHFEFVVVNILRIIVSCFAFVLASKFDSYCECLSDNNSVDSVKEAFRSCGFAHGGSMIAFVCLALTHSIDVILVACAVFTFFCRPEKVTTNTKLNKMLPSERRFSLLMKCFVGCTGLLTCGVFGGEEAVRSDYANFSFLLANFLNGNGSLDLAASDIFVGLYMIAMEKKLKKLQTRNRLVRNHTRISVLTNSSKSCSSQSEQSRNTNTNTNTGKPTVGTIEEDEMLPEISSDSNAIEVFPDEFMSTDRFTSVGSMIFPNDAEKANDAQDMEMLSSLHAEEVDLINEAAHFVVFAEAVYGVVAYMLRRPLTGPFSFFILLLRNCACFSPSRNESIVEDNVCNSRTIAVKAISGVTEKDIIYANYSESVSKDIPYVILLDHDWKSIVISIRGTMSLESVVTDIQIIPKELTALGEKCGFDGKGLYCHTGMLATTEWLYKDIEERGKLERVVADYKDYDLRITGHSLGAGVASILSYLLRPKYPQLRCLAFSPPGCVMSENLAKETETFTTSFVVNDDIIARMNYENFEELRDGVLEMICRIKIPKYQVTNVIKKYDDSTEEGLSDAIGKILCKEEDIEDSEFKRQVDKFLAFQQKLKEQHKDHFIKLCPPGSMIQLFRTKKAANDFGEQLGRHTARRAKRSDFEHIELSLHFFTDHETVKVTDNIHKLAEEVFGLSHPFSPQRTTAEP